LSCSCCSLNNPKEAQTTADANSLPLRKNNTGVEREEEEEKQQT